MSLNLALDIIKQHGRKVNILYKRYSIHSQSLNTSKIQRLTIRALISLNRSICLERCTDIRSKFQLNLWTLDTIYKNKMMTKYMLFSIIWWTIIIINSALENIVILSVSNAHSPTSGYPNIASIACHFLLLLWLIDIFSHSIASISILTVPTESYHERFWRNPF